MRFGPSDFLLDQVDCWRLEATQRLDASRRSELGQFLTPSPIASFMASFFKGFGAEVRLLDAGAGAGALLTAATLAATSRRMAPRRLHISAYEIDLLLAGYLRRSLDALATSFQIAGVEITGEVIQRDFIEAAVEELDRGLFGAGNVEPYTHAILNPPYRKLSSDSAARRCLRRVGVETSNLYTAFIALAAQRLAPGGELVAIAPRSFCNGPYFRPFREFLLRETAIQRIHVFESRRAAFSDDEVLQENVIFHVIKRAPQRSVVISSSASPADEPSTREVPFDQIVHPGDGELFIHLVPDEAGQEVAATFAKLPCKLPDLGLAVSTGKVIDFRAKEALRRSPGPGIGPLIYPTHLADGRVRWPKDGKKPNGLLDAASTKDLWVPSGTYVLVKRFSAKEERRRVVAAVFDPADVPGDRIGFENHLNVFHAAGRGLDTVLARGLAGFLNSSFVDTYFRQFNGHTQVNATDLRSLRYPAREVLLRLGDRIGDAVLGQCELDLIVEDMVGCRLDERRSRTKDQRSA